MIQGFDRFTMLSLIVHNCSHQAQEILKMLHMLHHILPQTADNYKRSQIYTVETTLKCVSHVLRKSSHAPDTMAAPLC